MTSEELLQGLAKLDLYYLVDHHADFVANASRHRHGVQQVIENLVRLELLEKSKRSTERRLRAARLGRYQLMTVFDWKWPKKIDREAIEELLGVTFLKEATNVILFGPAGAGKTMIAKNLAHEAVMAGHTAFFTDAYEMLTDLEQQDGPRTLKARLAKYVRPKLLVIDELGYLSYSTKAADLLFRVITGRYQQGSTVLTTNVPFKDWASVFPTASCLGALIDRLMHNADVITIDADSFRKKEATERKTRKQSPKKHKEPNHELPK